MPFTCHPLFPRYTLRFIYSVQCTVSFSTLRCDYWLFVLSDEHKYWTVNRTTTAAAAAAMTTTLAVVEVLVRARTVVLHPLKSNSLLYRLPSLTISLSHTPSHSESLSNFKLICYAMFAMLRPTPSEPSLRCLALGSFIICTVDLLSINILKSLSNAT